MATLILSKISRKERPWNLRQATFTDTEYHGTIVGNSVALVRAPCFTVVSGRTTYADIRVAAGPCGKPFASCILSSDDTVFLFKCSHGFMLIEDARIIEVKRAFTLVRRRIKSYFSPAMGAALPRFRNKGIKEST